MQKYASLPTSERCDRPYDIRLGCQYAFALVLGDPELDDDLLLLLPVLQLPG